MNAQQNRLYLAALFQGNIQSEKDLLFHERQVLKMQGPRAALLQVLQRRRQQAEVQKWAIGTCLFAGLLTVFGQSGMTMSLLIFPLIGGQWLMGKNQIDLLEFSLKMADALDEEPSLTAVA